MINERREKHDLPISGIGECIATDSKMTLEQRDHFIQTSKIGWMKIL
jgi:hypothetical protein